MKSFIFLLSLVGLLTLSHSLFFVPSQPQTNQAGQCPSGIPRDGLFQNCALQHWKVGHLALNDDLTADTTIDFGPDFTKKPIGVDFNLNANVNSSGCSLEMSGTGVVFQPLTNLRYAQYRMFGCAKSMGNSRCKMVVKDSFNRIVDSLEVRGRQCAEPMSAKCVECADGITNITMRYLGDRPTDIIVRIPGQTDQSKWRVLMNIIQNDEFTISPLDFPLDKSLGTLFPDSLEFVTVAFNDLTDVFNFNCSSFTALPGQVFGDRRQFIVVSAFADGEEFCAVNRVTLPKCECKEENNDDICMQSDRGFVAQPNDLYYLALESEECGCAFDNICFEQVGGPLGYFGVDWILGVNLTQADFQ